MRYWILAKYIAWRFVFFFLCISAVVLIILLISNLFDVLNVFRLLEIRPSIFWQLITCKIPYLFNEVCSLVAFFATLLFLQNISRSNELLIALVNGVQLWKIFFIPSLVTLVLGIIIIAVINPIGTMGLKRYKEIQSYITNTPTSVVTIGDSGVYFFEKYAENNRIIKADAIIPSHNKLQKIIIIITNDDNYFVQKIEAEEGFILDKSFILKKVSIISPNDIIKMDKIVLATSISFSDLMKQFLPPEFIPLWELNHSIKNMNKSGFATTSYQIYYYKQLFKPIIMVAMVMVAFLFTNIHSRNNMEMKLLVRGLASGVSVYFVLEILFRILAYGGISPIYAILLPVLLIMLISNFVILHFYRA